MTQVGGHRVLVLHPDDNVAIALQPLAAGETIAVGGSPLASSLLIRMPIPTGHKVALRTLGPQDKVIKYGQPVGIVTRPIAAGEHVHIHNVVSARAG